MILDDSFSNDLVSGASQRFTRGPSYRKEKPIKRTAISYNDLDSLESNKIDRENLKLIDTLRKGETLGTNEIDEFEEKREFTAISVIDRVI